MKFKTIIISAFVISLLPIYCFAQNKAVVIPLIDSTGQTGKAAFAGGDQSINLDLPDQTVRSTSITVPTSGIIIVNASGYVYMPVDTHYSRCSITTGTALDNSHLVIARGASYTPIASTRGYYVSAGDHTFGLVCDSNSNQVVIRDTNITAIFIPNS